MDWMLSLAAILGGLLFVMLAGVPIAFSFFLVTGIAILFLQGGGAAFNQLILSVASSISSFSLVPVPLFIFMGVVLWRANLGQKAIDALDQWLGRLPGRVSLLTIGSGAVFSAMSGSTVANTAMLGTMLMPEMEKRGYARTLGMGSIMAGGGLAMMIPPSALAVIFATIGRLSIAEILIASIIPGLLMGAFYIAYVVGRCVIHPHLAPRYPHQPIPFMRRVYITVRDILPIAAVIFSVSGVIVLGIATPSEAGALGALCSLLLAGFYGKLNLNMLHIALRDSVRISVMALAIVAAAAGYSQILAYSGATRGIVSAVTGADIDPIWIITGMLLIVLLLGSFMEQISIMLITLPIFIPVVISTGFDPIWFSVMMLVMLETGLMTPPFGLLLFVMKGVAPAGVTFSSIYRAATPFIVCNLLVIVVIALFPSLISDVLSLVRR